jgi:hypothetical protein
MANPWDVLPVEPQGDEEAVELYHAVGLALSLWEVLESAVATIYHDIVGFNSRAAMAAYCTISSSPGRIDRVLAAAEEADNTHISALQVEELKQLLVNEVGKLSGRRNEIAHGTVTHVSAPGRREGHFLMPPDYNTRKRIPYRKIQTGELPFKAIKYAYTAAQVQQYGEHFWNYAERIYDVVDALRESRRVRQETIRQAEEQTRRRASDALLRKPPNPA